MSYPAWRVSTVCLQVIAIMATGGLVAGIAIWGLTWASPRFTMPDWIFAPFFAFGIAGVFLSVALVAITHGKRLPLGWSYLRILPRWLAGVVSVLGTGFLLTGSVQLFRSAPGQPGYNSWTHQYFFDNHGSTIPTTRGPYLSAVAIQTRGFLSFAVAFMFVALLVSASELAQRKRIVTPRITEVAEPAQRPRLCPRAWVSAVFLLGAVTLATGPVTQIVHRVDAYASNGPKVTTNETVSFLKSGDWVVFAWCQTHATNAPYGCPSMSPSEIEIRRSSTGVILTTLLDRSVDHISPNGLPAAGQLTFSVQTSGNYELLLTQKIAKGVFLAPSPGSVARALAGDIVVTVFAVLCIVIFLILLCRRVAWRLRGVPRVDIELS